MAKVRIPINERMASKMAAEHKEIRGYTEESRTCFYNENDELIFEKVELGHPASEYKLVSYFGYVTKMEREDV